MATETTTETVAAAGYNTFPASSPPFPSIPTCPVNTISLANLRKSPAESEKFFQACKDLGFFYLDLRGDPEGEVMLKEASDLFEFSPKLFDLGKEELMKYWVELQVSLDGYKLFESKTKDENKEATYLEVYNVSCLLTIFNKFLEYHS
jgi:isopenicillin N synthase-like dioxygenase